LTSSDPIIIAAAVFSTAMLIIYIRTSGSAGASPMQIRQAIEKGLLLEQQQRWKEASLVLEDAVKMLRASAKPDLSQEVTCCVHLGNIYERLDEPEKARGVFDRAVADWKQLLQQRKLEPIDIDYAVTNLDFGRGTLAVAEFYVDNIITMREREFPPGSADLKNCYTIGANLLRRAGYLKEAELLERRGLEGPPKE
jgi:tetratricopeptide (TPR) repeat protein